MTVREFIDRLEELAKIAGDDAPVAVRVAEEEGRYETAVAELQTCGVSHVSGGWMTRSIGKNDTQIVVVWSIAYTHLLIKSLQTLGIT